MLYLDFLTFWYCFIEGVYFTLQFSIIAINSIYIYTCILYICNKKVR